MTRVVVFGGDGLLGSHLYLSLRSSCELCLTLHRQSSDYPEKLFSGAKVVYGISAADRQKWATLLDEFCPDWVINAVGAAKRDAAIDTLASLEANSVFPHQLAVACGKRGVRLLHFSTDCVFSGRKGLYSESDIPDAQDWYGRCKALGEPQGEHVLTLRTSFIGLELGGKKSLLEWFLARQGGIKGYRQAIWSGLSAIELGHLVEFLLKSDMPLNGLWHVAAPPISKYALLSALNDRLGARGVTVEPDDHFVCDRSLDGSKLEAQTGYCAPSWMVMLDGLLEDVRYRWRADAPSYWPFPGR